MWCQKDPTNYKHSDLPYGKDLYGDDLRKALERIFDEYCTDIVVAKLSPGANLQRNEALNSVIGSKTPKLDTTVQVKVMTSEWPVVFRK